MTPISAAIVTLKPGGLRELHWHPNADEWQYYITGKSRMTIFAAPPDESTFGRRNDDDRAHPETRDSDYTSVKCSYFHGASRRLGTSNNYDWSVWRK